MAASGTHRGWYRDIPNATLDAVYDGTDVMQLTAAGVVVPGTLTVTGAITQSGASTIADDIGLGIGGGNASMLQWVTDDANANKLVLQLPAGGSVDVPVLVLGQGAGVIGDMAIHNGIVDPTVSLIGVGAVTTGPVVEFRKSRGTAAAPTVVTSGDDIGRINFYGAVAAAEYVLGASIEADMAGTIATTRGPGTLTFKTATDAAPSVLTTAMTISAAQLVTLAAGLTVTAGATSFGGNVTASDDILVSVGTGSTARISWDTTDANANEMLIQLPAGGGTDVPVIAIGQAIESVDLGLFNGRVDPTVALLAAGAVTTGSVLEFRKARGTITSPTVVTSGDDIGTIDFYGAVAAGEYVRGATIRADMAGTIATTRGPSTLTFATATDAAPSVMTDGIVITAAQRVNIPVGPLAIGAAGGATGDIIFNGTTSGVVTLTVADAAGTWTMQLPAANGGAGEQLTDAGGNGITSWAAAASLRKYKRNIVERMDADEALDTLVTTPVYDFNYDPDAGHGTGDYDTRYVGVMADEAPWAMHYKGGIVNPVNTLGYTVLGFKAMAKRLDAALARIAQLEGKGLQHA